MSSRLKRCDDHQRHYCSCYYAEASHVGEGAVHGVAMRSDHLLDVNWTRKKKKKKETSGPANVRSGREGYTEL